ncbi:MAG: ABC transporter ATP-binding protein/permease [Aerococcus sp.]|nr:ABC transporter ATP-binding protein/permease [Aerococcus sp.]
MKVKNVLLKNKKRAILAFLSKTIESVLELMIPLVMAALIDQSVKTGDVRGVWLRGSLLIILPVIGYLFALICQWNASVVAQKSGTEIRQLIYEHMLRLDLSQIQQFTPAKIITMVTNDTVNIQDAIARTLRLVSRAPILLLGAIFLAITVSRELAPIFIITAMVIGIGLIIVTRITNKYYAVIQSHLDRLAQHLRENISGIRVIRAFAKQQKEIGQFKAKNQQLVSQQITAGRWQAMAMPMSTMLVNIAIGGILWFGSGLVNNGRFLQGEIVALVNYMNIIIQALQVLVNVITIMSRGFAGQQRIDTFLELKPEITGSESVLVNNDGSSQGSSVSYNNVSFGYGKHDVIKNIDLTIAPGERIGIIGATGSGKSTLVSLLMRLFEVHSGELRIDGTNIKQCPLHVLREQIAYVPQKNVLLRGTIRDNMKMGNDNLSDDAIWEALDIAQASDFIRRSPEQLDTMVSSEGTNFSGGQRQRLTIARALTKHAPLTILDDSASALDYTTEQHLYEALFAQPTTLIVVSQRIASLQSMDRIIVMDNGQIEAIGTHDALLETSETYRELYHSQFPDQEEGLDATSGI